MICGPGVPAHSFLINQRLVLLLDRGRGTVGSWASVLSMISPLQLLPCSATSLTLVWVPGHPSVVPTLQPSKTWPAPPPVSIDCFAPQAAGKGTWTCLHAAWALVWTKQPGCTHPLAAMTETRSQSVCSWGLALSSASKHWLLWVT